MPSQKIIRILRSKSTLTTEQIEVMSDGEGWEWLREHRPPRKEQLPSVCFTGFLQAEREELRNLALAWGIFRSLRL